MNFKDYMFKLPATRNFIFNNVYINRIEQLKHISPAKKNGVGRTYEKDILILRWDNPSAGLFAYVLSIIGQLYYADMFGYAPVVDMQSYKNTYLNDYEIGKKNAWNFYFENLCDLSLQDTAQYSNVFFGDKQLGGFSPNPSVGWMNNRNLISEWQNLVQKYIRLNAVTYSFCEKSRCELLKDTDKVLGVKVRGTDYKADTAKGHPIQPDVLTVVKKSRKVMQKYNCNKIYLSTEDKSVIGLFEQEFKDNLVISDSVRVEYTPSKIRCISKYSTGRENDRYIQGLEYVRDIYILSKCNCLIGGINGGSAAALIFGNSFEYKYFWYCGRY